MSESLMKWNAKLGFSRQKPEESWSLDQLRSTALTQVNSPQLPARSLGIAASDCCIY